MGGILSSLSVAAGNLQVFDRALTVVQSNVANSDTPGYVKQRIVFQAGRFQPENGDSSALLTGPVRNSRDPFAEQAVWRSQQRAGFTAQSADSLARLQTALPVNEQAAIPLAINGFFNAVSQWSVNPNAASARQPVLSQADRVASAFRSTAAEVATQVATADRQILSTVDNINGVARQVQELNTRILAGAGLQQDPGLDAQMHNAIEQLSEYANVSAFHMEDGTVTVLIAGQQSLVSGGNLHPLSVSTGNSGTAILDSQGNDATAEISGGQLGALLQTRNRDLPSVQLQLNQLAQAVADQVNTALRSGLDQTGNPPTQDLFAYGSTAEAASSLKLNSLTAAQLAGASQGAAGGNGNALQLASLSSAPTIQGGSFTAFYSAVAAQVGRQKNAADADAQTDAAVLVQTRALREQASSVSLDEEAAHLMTLQRGYQALAKMVTALDSLNDSIMGMLR